MPGSYASELSHKAVSSSKMPLPHIVTMLKEEQLPRAPRQSQIGILATIPSPTSAETPVINKRHSRSILGLFSRNKSSKDDFKEEASSTRKKQSNDLPIPRDKSKRTSYMGREQSQKFRRRAESIPFCEVLPRATKHITLAIPTLDADSLLRLAKQREEAQRIVEEEQNANVEGQADARRAKLDDIPFGWKASIFVLTKDGIIYQYPAAGMPDRLPDCCIQLNSGSAAFASDAVPGRHWVLQIALSFSQEIPPAAGKSRLSRLGLRSVKSTTNNMLLVMESAMEMESWLAAVRQEITYQGSETYQTSTSALNRPLKGELKRGIVTDENSPSIRRASSTKRLSNDTSEAVLINQLEITASIVSRNGRPSLSRSISDESRTTVVKAATKNLSHLVVQMNSQDASAVSAGIQDTSNQSLLRWAPPANFSPTFSPTTRTFPGGQANQASEGVTTRSYRSQSTASDGAPNFSVPIFSNRFSQSTRSGTSVATPPQSSGSSHRAPSPVQSSKDLLGRRGVPALPFIVTGSNHLEMYQDQGSTPNSFQQEWLDREAVHAVPAKFPKRYSSLVVLNSESSRDSSNNQSMYPPVSYSPTRPLLSQDFSIPSLSSRRFSSSNPESPRILLATKRASMTNPRSPSIIVTPGLPNLASTPNSAKKLPDLPMDAYQLRRMTALGISHSKSFEALKRISVSYSPTAPTQSVIPISPPQRSPVASKFNPASRPQSLHLGESSNRLQNRASLSHLSPAQTIQPMAIRQRRSIPAHLHGPPLAPPPNLPLPAVPRPKVAIAGC